MSELVFLVHGWSVTSTKTYQDLHRQLDNHGFNLQEINLGRYVSLDNDVEIKDIAGAMDRALKDKLKKAGSNRKFHIITHSTGALVVKYWVVKHYVGSFAAGKRLKNLVFLAGPHFGSRLAHHGRTMLAHLRFGGDTGKKILESLELGSAFSWDNNSDWLDKSNWKQKGIKPYCLIGHRVIGNFVKSKIFPAAFEKGSDMVVRVPAGNLNFRRFVLDTTKSNTLRLVGEISGVPFGALGEYVHSGEKAGIMNSIKVSAGISDPRYLNLKLIVDCLKVDSAAKYAAMGNTLKRHTKKTRDQLERGKFAQLDFWFRDQHGAPIDDYRFELGAYKNGDRKVSKTVASTHKNKVDGSHFTVFLNLKEFEPKLTYFMNLKADSGTELVKYDTNPLDRTFAGKKLKDIICENQTTQIEVILERKPQSNLFVFHKGTDSDLHVKWNRLGEISKIND